MDIVEKLRQDADINAEYTLTGEDVLEAAKEIATLRRQFAIAKMQWDGWKEEAMRLNARLQKYEPGSVMLLNGAVPNAELRGEPLLASPARTTG